jgi:hypothetical protein
MKLSMHFIAPDPYQQRIFLIPSPSSVCVPVYISLLSLLGKGSVKCIPPLVARQRLGEHVPGAKNTRNNRRIVRRVCLWVCASSPSPSLLLGNYWVKTFPRQRRTVEGVVLDAVRFEITRLVLPRTSCSLLNPFTLLVVLALLWRLYRLELSIRDAQSRGTAYRIVKQTGETGNACNNRAKRRKLTASFRTKEVGATREAII